MADTPGANPGKGGMTSAAARLRAVPHAAEFELLTPGWGAF